MRIAQILLPDASEYERKCRRADFEALSAEHDVVLFSTPPGEGEADVAHAYGTGVLPPMRIGVPFVSSAAPPPSRWRLRRMPEPAFIVSPLFEKGEGGRERLLPEPVERSWFEWQAATGGWSPPDGEVRAVGSFARPGMRNLVEQTLARIGRVRSDVSWILLEGTPRPEDLAGIDLWADPATSADDLDGFVAEALVAGVPVVAARTRINEIRLEQGRTGMLVRPGDPNEWSHAILTALFKPEGTEARLRAARQTISRFRSGQRQRTLGRLYQALIS